MKTSHFKLFFSLTAIVFLSTAFAPSVLEEGSKGKDFKQFLSYFDAVDLPYFTSLTEIENYIKSAQSINLRRAEQDIEKERELYLAKRELSKAISDPDFMPEAYFGKISRMGPPMFEPLAQFELNENMVGVVYSSTARFNNFHKQYKMLVYNKKGELLNTSLPETSKSIFKLKSAPRQKAFLIGHTSIQESATFNLDKQGHIWKNIYQHEWANDMQECPIEENTLVHSKLVDTQVFKVNAKGMIEEMKEYPTVAKAGLD